MACAMTSSRRCCSMKSSNKLFGIEYKQREPWTGGARALGP